MKHFIYCVIQSKLTKMIMSRIRGSYPLETHDQSTLLRSPFYSNIGSFLDKYLELKFL